MIDVGLLDVHARQILIGEDQGKFNYDLGLRRANVTGLCPSFPIVHGLCPSFTIVHGFCPSVVHRPLTTGQQTVNCLLNKQGILLEEIYTHAPLGLQSSHVDRDTEQTISKTNKPVPSRSSLWCSISRKNTLN